MPAVRRVRVAILTFIFVLISFYYLTNQRYTWNYGYTSYIPALPKSPPADGNVHWSKLTERYPVTSLISLPTGSPNRIPQIQASPPTEDRSEKAERIMRRDAVKNSFSHSWEGYKQFAWLRDEVTPLSEQWKDTFGGWAATLVDALDTLWIMGMKEEFELAVAASEQIDFTTTEAKTINVFETTIRYLGGFLAAYDVSEGNYPVLLNKAVEVGELLMSCFDTPNRMPISRWDWKEYTKTKQTASDRLLVSELGSLSLEFTRLSQLTGDVKYYDAVQRVADELEKSQNSTQLPGMWPIMINARTLDFSADNTFTLGGMSDSLYEYLPKQFLLLGGLLSQPKDMYENFIDVAKNRLFHRIYNPHDLPISMSLDIVTQGGGGSVSVRPQGQHLSCFTGGMVGLGSRIFERPEDLQVAAELAAGCVWAYDTNVNGVGPELFYVMPCPSPSSCNWTDSVWHDAVAKRHGITTESETDREKQILEAIQRHRLPPGFTSIDDRRYILRPEAIESVFMMWRITGDKQWQEAAWRMFEHVEKVSRTAIAASAIDDMTATGDNLRQSDSMESFWLAETLKYFYLCFEDFDAVSLDEYVLNTEAHPLRRPR